MKRLFSALLCILMLAGLMPNALAADLETITLSKGVLGTLGSSGVSYQARLTVPGYLGQLEINAQTIADMAHAAGALCLVGVDPITLGCRVVDCAPAYTEPLGLIPAEIAAFAVCT